MADTTIYISLQNIYNSEMSNIYMNPTAEPSACNSLFTKTAQLDNYISEITF